MKKLLIFAFAVFAFAACTQNDVEELSANRADVPDTLTVGFEGGDDTRIQLNEAQKTVWTKDDLVSVFYRSNANQKWQYQGETGERVGVLKRLESGVATQDLDNVVVVYPYNENYYINTETYNIEATLPAVQHYAEESYGVGENLMVSCDEDNHISLRNVCGWLKIQLTGNGERVQSITLRGNNEEQLAGLIYVDTATAESTLASEMGSADDNNAGGNLVFDDAIVTELTLDCGEGVVLGAEATSFYFALPPQTFEGGFTVDVECEDSEPMAISTENSVTIQRNTIQPMAAFEFINQNPPTQPTPASNQIWYTSSDGKVVTPYDTNVFGANIKSNTYTDGKGVITFNDDVTTIGYEAFWNRDNLTSVTIPDSVTTIGERAFYDCDSLTEFNGKFASEDGKCLIIDGTLNSFAIGCGATEYTIPDSVTTIGKGAFAYCRSLTSITIPDSVTTIGEWAFYLCNSLTSITIPDSVTTIGNRAFYYCLNLTNINLPDSVTTIGNYAFFECYSLTSVCCEATTPPSLGGSDVFDNNASGRTIYVPEESVRQYKIAAGWSEYTDAIVGIDFSTTSIINYTTSDDQIINARLPIISNTYSNGIGAIEFWGSIILERAFRYCSNLTSVTIPDSVTTIGDYAFDGCKSLASITIPDSVTTIGEYAFCRCSNLTSITIGDSVTTIGDCAFFGCNSLTSVTIGDSVTTIGGAAFRDCTSLTSVTIPDSVTTIGDSAFRYCSNLTSVTIGDSVTTIGEWAFYECYSLTSVTIGDSVTTIEWYAFYDCNNLTSITIPDSVTTIGDSAFENCDGLTSVYCEATTPPSLGGSVFSNNASGLTIYVPAASAETYKTDYWSKYADVIVGIDFSITSIINYTTYDGQIVNARLPIISNTYSNGIGTVEFWGSIMPVETFYNCDSLTSVTIGDSVTTIGDYAFFDCNSLTNITIPDSVTTIGDCAFEYCKSLTSITIPDSVTTIGGSAFQYCSSLTSVTIPDSVTTIGDGAFSSCNSLTEFNGKFASEDGRCLIVDGTLNSFAPAGLTSYTVHDSVTTIGNYAFSDCESLTSVTIPDSVTTIGDNAFYECYSLASITIPDSVTTIGRSAFRNCDSLTSITIPDSVTTIETYVFYGCNNLTSITIPDSVTTIGDYAFGSCRLTSVTIPDSVTTIGNYAFYWCSSLWSVHCEATTPPSLGGTSVFDKNASDGQHASRTIYVPAASVGAYKSARYWSEYKSAIVGYDFENGLVVE